MKSLRTTTDPVEFFAALAALVIADATSFALGIHEGQVRSPDGVAAYRRLDCELRSLAYVRARPRRKKVRIDVSGLWAVPHESPLRKPSSSGLALEVTSEKEAREAAAYLRAIVQHTRALRETAEKTAAKRGAA